MPVLHTSAAGTAHTSWTRVPSHPDAGQRRSRLSCSAAGCCRSGTAAASVPAIPPNRYPLKDSALGSPRDLPRSGDAQQPGVMPLDTGIMNLAHSPFYRLHPVLPTRKRKNPICPRSNPVISARPQKKTARRSGRARGRNRQTAEQVFKLGEKGHEEERAGVAGGGPATAFALLTSQRLPEAGRAAFVFGCSTTRWLS